AGVAGAGVAALDERDGGQGAGAEGRPALVQRDGVEPGLERPRVVVLPALEPDGQEHLLEQLLAPVAVADHPGDESGQRAGRAADERLEELGPAVGHPGHQVLVAFGGVHPLPPGPLTSPYARRRGVVEAKSTPAGGGRYATMFWWGIE